MPALLTRIETGPTSLATFAATSRHAARSLTSSVKLCALLHKPARTRAPVQIDYLGFTIPDEFVVGYGLDAAQKYRNLKDLRILEE